SPRSGSKYGENTFGRSSAGFSRQSPLSGRTGSLVGVGFRRRFSEPEHATFSHAPAEAGAYIQGTHASAFASADSGTPSFIRTQTIAAATHIQAAVSIVFVLAKLRTSNASVVPTNTITAEKASPARQ